MAREKLAQAVRSASVGDSRAARIACSSPFESGGLDVELRCARSAQDCRQPPQPAG